MAASRVLAAILICGEAVVHAFSPSTGAFQNPVLRRSMIAAQRPLHLHKAAIRGSPSGARAATRLHSLRPEVSEAVQKLRDEIFPVEAIEVLLQFGLDPTEAAALVEIATQSRASAGEDLLKDDESSGLMRREVHLVVLGDVQVSRGERRLSKLGAGAFLGENRFLEVEALEALQEQGDSPLDRAFAAASKGSGQAVGKEEAAVCLEKVGITSGTAELAGALISKIDTDQDGRITLDDVNQAAVRLKNAAKDLFTKADRDETGFVNTQELQRLLLEAGDVDVSDEAAGQIMSAIGGVDGKVSLMPVLERLKRLTQNSGLRRLFDAVDVNHDEKIDESEMETLLNNLGLRLSRQQVSLLFQSVRMHSDATSVDYLEFETALNRVKGRILPRDADALTLFDSVAFRTQVRSQTTATAATNVRYLSWDYDKLSAFLNDPQHIRTSSRIRRTWALQLSERLCEMTIEDEDEPIIQVIKSNSNAPNRPKSKDVQVEPGDYGYGDNFAYGEKGDYGPLGRAVPGGLKAMAFWNFGREFRALQTNFRYDQLKELVESFSGARQWQAVREAILDLACQRTPDKTVNDLEMCAGKAFENWDRDKSGSLSSAEFSIRMKECGVALTEEQVKALYSSADKNGDDSISSKEFQGFIRDVYMDSKELRAEFGASSGWLPGFIARPILGVLLMMAGGKETPKDAPEVISPETQKLRTMLGQLRLDNDSVWRREDLRKAMLQKSIMEAESQGDKTSLFRKQMALTESLPIVMGPYYFLCWLLDVLFVNRPLTRFWFLEMVARMPYLSYSTMLALYESLGWWRASSDARRVHFAEEWNEVQHLRIMEALGGGRLWIDRFMAQHAALFYWVILNHVWLISPSVAYNFSELIEFHAVDTYGEFVDTNEELLKRLPAPKEAVEYYSGGDKELFDEFQTGREPGTRRPAVQTLYDVFCEIRDDELEHVKTMFQCQIAESQIVSPNYKKAMATWTAEQAAAGKQ